MHYNILQLLHLSLDCIGLSSVPGTFNCSHGYMDDIVLPRPGGGRLPGLDAEHSPQPLLRLGGGQLPAAGLGLPQTQGAATAAPRASARAPA